MLQAAAALLAISAFLPLTSSEMLSRQRRSMPARTLTEPQFLATAVPVPTWPAELRARDSPNTICGFIGGDTALPATCMKGSHCAVDVEHGIMGCCPDGHPCTKGIFTGCVDKNSGPQTFKDPYVFTCGGGDVCYRNTFDGGLYQFGCGAGSRLATSVATTAPGHDPLDIRRVTFDLTATPTSLSSPVTVDSTPAATSDENSHATTPSSAGAADAPPNGGRSPNTGAIVGGIIGGIAGLVILVALMVFLCRRRRRRPAHHGPDSKQEMRYSSPMTDTRHNFEPLHSSQGPPPEASAQPGFRQSGQPDARDSLQPHAQSQGGHPNGALSTAGIAGIRDRNRDMDLDQVPLTREVDGMSSGVNSQETVQGTDHPPEPATYSTSSYPGPRRSGGGALWQQNRRERRNLVWI